MMIRTERQLVDDAKQSLKTIKATEDAERETINATEAADFVGISTWSIYDLCRRGLIPHIKVGRRILFRKASLLKWLDERENESTVKPVLSLTGIREIKK